MGKSPGPIKHGSQDHEEMLQYTKALVRRFGFAEPAALGLLIKFDKQIGKAMKTSKGMASLKIEVDSGSIEINIKKLKKLIPEICEDMNDEDCTVDTTACIGLYTNKSGEQCELQLKITREECDFVSENDHICVTSII